MSERSHVVASRLAGSVLALVAALGACGSEPEPPEPDCELEPVPPVAEDVRVFFPATVGDRWRERVAGGPARTRGVTAIGADGLVVIFGQGDRAPAFHRLDARLVALVRPDGTVIEPILRAPLELGASHRYALGDGAASASCEAVVAEVDVSHRVGELGLGGCVRVRRTCEHPAGGPFATPTTRVTTELHCPRVGRVLSRTELDPPLPGADAPAEVELVAFRVAGGPAAPTARFDCDAMLLLPSDVQAACGPSWSFVTEGPVEGGCAHRFERGEARLEVRVVRAEDPAAAARATESAMDAFGGESLALEGLIARRAERGLAIGSTEGTHALWVEVSGGCDPERAARLFPLLRSLAR